MIDDDTNSVLNSLAIIEPLVSILPDTCRLPVVPISPTTLRLSPFNSVVPIPTPPSA